MCPVGVHKKRSLSQILWDDIKNDESKDDIRNNSTNPSPPKRPRKSHNLEQNTTLQPEPFNGLTYMQNNSDRSIVRHQQTKSSLLRKYCHRAVNSPPSALTAFEFREEHITFDDVIGIGAHSTVFRITAGGRTFALKVHKYTHDITSDPTYPEPNTFFDSEFSAYQRLSAHGSKACPQIPTCYGYVNLTTPPQQQSRIPRHPTRSTTYRPAVYLSFIRPKQEMEEEEVLGHDREVDERWKRYFKNKHRPKRCILRGLVFDEVAGHALRYTDTSNGSLLRSGRQALRCIHNVGVLHGDVRNTENALVAGPSDKPEEQQIVWIDFSAARFSSDMEEHTFAKKAVVEIKAWEKLFK